MIASVAPSRLAVRATSSAVLPPPYTTTRRPSIGLSSPSMLRSTDTASSMWAASPAGMYARLAMCAPTARNAASKWPAVIVSTIFVTFVFSSSSTPMSRMRCTSPSSTSRGNRYLGIPKRIMPPASGPASTILTLWPRRRSWYAADNPEGPAPTMRTRLPLSVLGGGNFQPSFSASSPRKRSTELMPTGSSTLPRLHEVSQG